MRVQQIIRASQPAGKKTRCMLQCSVRAAQDIEGITDLQLPRFMFYVLAGDTNRWVIIRSTGSCSIRFLVIPRSSCCRMYDTAAFLRQSAILKNGRSLVA